MKKKVIFLIGSCVFLIIIAIVLMTRSNQRISEETTSVLTTAGSQQIQHGSLVPSKQSDNPVKWKTYTGDGFTVQYPPDWNVQSTTIAGGGDVILVRPQVLPVGVNYPQFMLQKQPFTNTTFAEKAGFLQGLSMTVSDVKVAGFTAKKYSGTIPFKTVGNQTLKEPIQDSTYLLINNGTLYLLKYEYEGSAASDLLEEFFTGFTGSFKTGQ
jgi:hypothetical protein